MKLSQMTQDIATACSVKPRVVSAIQQETFRKMLATLNTGERVYIGGFGVFGIKEVAGEEGQPAKKIIRFRQRGEADEKDTAEATEGASVENKKKARAERKNQKAEAEVKPTEAEAVEE
jgi:nucleoid DNA-binding protein